MRGLPILAVLLLAGCTQMRDIGVAPPLSPVGSGVAPTPVPAYAYPKEPSQPVTRFSLWDDRQSRLFTDPRAIAVGDILTVEISISDEAHFKNETDRKRDATRSLGLAGAFDIAGNGTSGNGNADIDSLTDMSGTGEIKRSETLDLRVAAVVTGVLPTGNLRIAGSQEVRVNQELRVLTIDGLVRPTDIGPRNTIPYDRIAAARISYGGRGRLSEVQQPAYGHQVLDAVLPF
jgi:flagellar L-ring protein precursor FlgH